MKNVYNIVAESFRRKREARETELAQRIEQLEEKYPEYADWNRRQKRLPLAILSLIGRQDEDAAGAAQSIRDRRRALSEERKEIFQKHRIPQEYDQLWVDCKICKDEGFTYDEQGIRHKCRCFIREEIALKQQFSGLSSVMARENFDTFDYSLFSEEPDEKLGMSHREYMENLVRRAQDYVANFDRTEDNLLFMGGTGTGKSFLSHAIAKELLFMNRSVLYLTSMDLLDALRAEQFGNTDEDSVLMEDILGCDFLIIDDLGAESVSEYVIGQLFSVLNGRILSGKKFLISTNDDFSALRRKYGERILSRIQGTSDLFYFTGDDLRLIKRKREAAYLD